MTIYGPYEETLNNILFDVEKRIRQLNQQEIDKHQPKLYEHLIGRVKTPASMEEKCQRKNYPLTVESALRKCRDAVGIRIVCNFISDIDRCLAILRNVDWCSVIKEKDYISNAKPNGYRSYHLILDVIEDYRDVDGHLPGHFYVEIQLRTIAMDSWASLEHEIKYKHNVKNPERIGKELKRCADQLASCDIQMETIRQLIQED
ncbi:GTP pyrophosphokinase [Limosilactobacillus agrestimuris]|uniref:GTP pyrophosphokinase n=1 Tax=Limosilactobacillus agrestimuris TaxID=2941331 RepID=UPI00203DEBD6|nr:GTP pyrophosphokinase family protein [Limosilactobacillus agrestimuris]